MTIMAGLSPTPVFRDGLSSSLSYVFLAIKNEKPYNCVVYSPGITTLKFYPDAEFWQVTSKALAEIGVNKALYTRDDYQGLHGVSRQEAERILAYVSGLRSVVAVPLPVFQAETFVGGRASSRNLHPATRRVPSESDLPKYEQAAGYTTSSESPFPVSA